MGQEATVYHFLSDNADPWKTWRKPHQKKQSRGKGKVESHSDCFVIKQHVFEWLGEEIVIKMHLENNICKPIVVLTRMGGGGGLFEKTDSRRVQQ